MKFIPTIILLLIATNLTVAQRQSFSHIWADSTTGYRHDSVYITSKLGVRVAPDSSLTTNSFRVKGGMRVDSTFTGRKIYFTNSGLGYPNNTLMDTISGINVSFFGNYSPQRWGLYHGNYSSPTTTVGSTFKIVRIQRLNLSDMGNNKADQDANSALSVNNVGLAGDSGQVVGLSVNSASYAPFGAGTDVMGLGAMAWGKTGFAGVANNYLEGRRDSSNSIVTGLEVRAADYSSRTSLSRISTVGTADSTTAIWITGHSGSSAREIGSAITVANPFTTPFKYGLVFRPTAIDTASILDNSSSPTSIQINGTHSSAALAVGLSSGSVGIGTLAPSHKLHVVGGDITVSNTGLGQFGSDLGRNLELHGSVGTAAYIDMGDSTSDDYDWRMLSNVGASQPFSFRTHTSDSVLYLTNGGLIGVGTTAPDSQFTTKLGIHGNRGLRVDGQTTLASSLTGTARLTSGVVSATPSDTVGLGSSLAGKQASGTYLVPSDSTSLRAYSNSLYLKNADSTTERTYSNSLYPAKTITHTIVGTSGQIRSSAGAQDHSANTTWTLSQPDTLLYTVFPNVTYTKTSVNTTTNTVAQSQDTSATYFSFTGTAKPQFDMVGTTGNSILHVDSSGNVGIGTNVPATQVASTQRALTIKGATSSGIIELETAASDLDGRGLGNIQWTDLNSTAANKAAAAISGNLSGSTANNRGGALLFYTKKDNTSGLNERVRIDSIGNFGIGTAAPSVTFSIAEKFLINSSGLSTKYNNIATVKNGVPSEYATVDLTAQTANIGATTVYAVPAAGVGMYRINTYVVETTAGSVSSTLPNVQILYTDNETGGVITIDATPVLGAAGIGQTGALTSNTVGTASSGVIAINAKASTNIQYQTVNYASTTAGMAYALHIRVIAE